MQHRCLIGLFALLILALVPSLALAQDDGGAIAYGDTVTGNITDDAPEVTFTFEGQAGDVITIAMEAVESNLDSYLILRDAAGEQLAFNDDTSGTLNSLIGPYIVPEDGTYTVTATRCCGGSGNSTGAFELTLRAVVVPTIGADESFTVTLDAETPAEFAFFSAEDVADVVRVDAVRVNGDGAFSVEVSDQSGRGYFGRGIDQTGSTVIVEPIVVDSEETYLLALRSQNRPPLPPVGGEVASPPLGLTATIEVDIVPVEPESFADQSSYDAVLSDETPVDYYSFEAEAGSLYALEASQTPDSTGFVELVIYGPGGFSVNGGTTAFGDEANRFQIDPLITDLAGIYTIVARRIDVNGMGIDGNRVTYTVTLEESAIETLSGNVTVTGMVGGEGAFEQLYRYVGEAGQDLTISIASIDENYAPALDIQTPASDDMMMNRGLSNVFSSQSGTIIVDVTLPVDGVYLIRVTNGVFSPDGPISGEFELTISTE